MGARILAVIPARYDSSRLPGKPLVEIGGRPMVQWVYEAAARVPSVERVVVATDDERVVRAVERFGGEVVLTSPAHPSGSDRVAEVARRLGPEVVVNLQGDEPLIEPHVVEDALRPLLEEPEVAMSTLCTRIHDEAAWRDPNVVKVVRADNGDALYFSRAPIPHPREARPLEALPVFKHLGLYCYRAPFLERITELPPSPLERIERLEQLRVLEAGYRIRVVETAHDTVGVDTPEDLERVRRLVVGSDAGSGGSTGGEVRP
ncbi:MAG: 3-deoxy-manno-octulosonate cytidylyltransferase [Nitrospirae bacterium]|nr:MAG: 3-deoxy-manno-octulosonate cytidylyltransferase [Nitrospirota bacterium]